MNKEQAERFNDKFGPGDIADYEIKTDDIIKCINLINNNKHEELLDFKIDAFTNPPGNTINYEIKEIKRLKTTQNILILINMPNVVPIVDLGNL